MKFARPMIAATIAITLGAGIAQAGGHAHRARHAHHRHHPTERFYGEDSSEGAYTRSDDRVYGGAYYGFFTSPSYGRYQSY